jgi:RNA polymerase sporulation-specific sigma factor
MADYLSLPDEELCLLCRADDEKAWNALFERFVPTARRLASRMHSGFLDEQDLAAEGMIGLLSAVDGFSPEPGASFAAYAYTCMRNRMLGALRAVQGKRRIPPSRLVPIDDEIDAPHMVSAEDALVSEQEVRRIGQIVDRVLSARERDVFLMFVGGVSYQQISAQTGLSSKAVDAAL